MVTQAAFQNFLTGEVAKMEAHDSHNAGMETSVKAKVSQCFDRAGQNYIPAHDGFEQAEADYREWCELERQNEELEARRKRWEKAMPHRNLIFMDKMHECPHEEPNPLIEKLIWPGSLTIIAGDPKAGKSTFLLHALEALSQSKDFCGLKTRRAVTLYASEQPFQSLYAQVKRLPSHETNKHVAFIPYEFNYIEHKPLDPATGGKELRKTFPASWTEQVNFWREKVKEIQAKLFIVDTFSAFAMFHSGEAYDSGPVTTRLQQLKALQSDTPDLAIIVCHHLRKEDQDGSGRRSFSDIANSYALRAASDTNIILYRPSRKAENENLRVMQVESRFIEEPVRLAFRKDGSVFALCEEAAAASAVRAADEILEQVLATPELNNLSVRELADRLGLSKSAVGRFREVYPPDHEVFQIQKCGT